MNYLIVKLCVVFSKFSLCRRRKGRRVMLLIYCDALKIEIIIMYFIRIDDVTHFHVLIQITVCACAYLFIEFNVMLNVYSWINKKKNEKSIFFHLDECVIL